jgi:hypothetical protein
MAASDQIPGQEFEYVAPMDFFSLAIGLASAWAG